MNDTTAPPERTLRIKNMVCRRCIMAVRSELERLGLEPLRVGLGVAVLPEPPSAETLEAVREALRPLGFELLGDRRAQTVERIRNAVVEWVHYGGGDPNGNLSDYLSVRLGRDYDSLSRLFSEATGTTIEKYLTAQKIERAKELLVYGEMTLAEIADALRYASAAYFSARFKSITGMTPGAFRRLGGSRRKPLDEV